MNFAAIITLHSVAALWLNRIDQKIDYLPDFKLEKPPENENVANDDLRHTISAVFIRPDDKEARDRFELQIRSTQIDTLTRHELIEAHLCLSYIKTKQIAKHNEIMNYIKPFKAEDVLERFSVGFEYLEDTPYRLVAFEEKAHHHDILDRVLDLFIMLHVIGSGVPLLAKFQIHETFEMLDDGGHIPASGGAFHLDERFLGKLRMIHHVYDIPKTQEFVNQIRKCFTDEIVRSKFCLPIILNGRLDSIEDAEAIASGEFRQQVLGDTLEFVYNAISQFHQNNLTAIAHHLEFDADLLITECVLRDANGISNEVKLLRSQSVVLENMRDIKRAIRASNSLHMTKRIALETCGVKSKIGKAKTGEEMTELKPKMERILNFFQNRSHGQHPAEEYAPVYLQYLIHVTCDTFGDHIFQSHAEILQRFRETQISMKMITSNMRNLGRFNEFIRRLIEDIFESHHDGKRKDLIALKTLYLTLGNMHRVAMPTGTIATLSIGNRSNILIVHNSIESSLVHVLNVKQHELATRELLGLVESPDVAIQLDKLSAGVNIYKDLQHLAVSVLTLKNLDGVLEDAKKWSDFEKLISDTSRSNIHVPIALQIGIVGLEDVLPEHKTESFEAIIGEFEGIAEVRKTVRKWLDEFYEVNSFFEFGIFATFSTITNTEANDEKLELVKMLYLALGNIDLLEINRDQLSFTNMMMVRWTIDALNKVKTNEMRDIRTLTLSDDSHQNFAFIKSRLLEVLDRSALDSKRKRNIKANYEFQGKLVALLLSVSQPQNELAAELNVLLSTAEPNIYLAPPIACGIYQLLVAHGSIKIPNLPELEHACRCFMELMDIFADEDNVTEWNALWTKLLKNIYTEPDDNKRRHEIIRFYTYLGGFHGGHRNQMSTEITVRLRIALLSLSDVYPSDQPTIEWLSFAETEHTDISMPQLEHFIHNFQEIDDFQGIIKETENGSQLCSLWLMILLKARFCKRHTSKSDDYDRIIRSTQYPRKMVEIDSHLEPHCVDGPENKFLNEIRCELDYAHQTGLATDALNAKDYCKIAAKKSIQAKQRAGASPRAEIHVPHRARRGTKHFPDELIKSEKSKLAPHNPQPDEHRLQWPYLEPVSDAATDDETDTETRNKWIIFGPTTLPDTHSAGPLKSSINTPEVQGEGAKPIRPRAMQPRALMGPVLSKKIAARKPNDSDVVKRTIDPLFANISVSPFPQSGRWAYEQLKVANKAQADAIKTENERLAATGPNARLLSTRTDIEQNMANARFNVKFIQAFAGRGTFEELKAQHGTECRELTSFLYKYYPNGLPTVVDLSKQALSQTATVSSSSPTVAAPKTPSAPSALSPASAATSLTQSTNRIIRSSVYFPEPITAADLENAKQSTNWFKRNAALNIVIQLTFSDEFNKAYKVDGEGIDLEKFPGEDSKYRQLWLDYQIDEDE